jgi:uncharacterized membrane protein
MSSSKIRKEEIEKTIQEIEQALPLEIRVAITTGKLSSPIGGIRSSIFFLLLFSLCLDIFWIPFPAWIVHLLAIPIIFLPAKYLVKIPLGNMFMAGKEVEQTVAERARQIFRSLQMGSTQTGNALLILFCIGNRRFHILPDPRMEAALAEKEWQTYAALISDVLKKNSQDPDNGITRAVLELLQRVKESSLPVLGKRKESDPAGELENKVLEFRS